MIFNLFLEYYNSSNPDRQKELEECISHNINNELIHKIYLFINTNDNVNIKFKDKKINIIEINERLTYKTVFSYSNSIYDENNYTINCLINSDIILTKDIEKFLKDNLLYNFGSNNIVFAISRHEGINPNTAILCEQPHVSQDAWIWQNKINMTSPYDGDFNLGKPGCDNLIVTEFIINGYTVINNATQIKILHNHNTNIRTWNVSERIFKSHGYTGIPIKDYPNFQYFRDPKDITINNLKGIKK